MKYPIGIQSFDQIIEDGYVKEDNGLSDEGAKTWKKGEF